MSENRPPPAAPTTTNTLEERAPGLARAHQPLTRARVLKTPLVDLPRLTRVIDGAAAAFRTPRPEDRAYQKAAEWLLDNRYLVARTLRRLKRDLPNEFRSRLLHVAGDELPRIQRVARAVVEATGLDFDEFTLLQFTHAYQSVSPLSIAELWAFPTTLRISVLEALAEMLAGFFPAFRSRSDCWDLPLDPALGVARAVRSLRQLAEIDWKTFFQKVSVVEAALRSDPAGVYARSDFQTRDLYRKVVENLAWGSEHSEADVAQRAVARAVEYRGEARRGHVGYYLIDRGRAELEREIAYVPLPGERLRRALYSRPTLAYLGCIGFGTLLVVAGCAVWGAQRFGLGGGLCLACVASIPASSIVSALTNWAVTRFLPPRTLPKLDFADGVPDDCRTAVVIPALIGRADDVDQLLAQLERHFLANPDPSLSFVLLADHVDSPRLPDDAALLEHAGRALRALDEKHASHGRSPFHLLYRSSRWNPAEGVFMAWERKRGKLEEFNRLLRGDRSTSFSHCFGDTARLLCTRFVITLDADTHLPLGAAQKLVGLLAHPLNHAEFDEKTGRVVAGYTVVQPRVEGSPAREGESPFSRVFAGDTALDIYTHAVSDVYQDLFGAGAYVGKGIYDVDAFMRSLEGRIPENAVASHDLLEGIHGRAALATDIVLFEEYPQHYLTYARRAHRWIRGDWQLLPWLLRFWPLARPRLPLSSIDRWKMADNLRRSLLAPALFALVCLGFYLLPAHAFWWASAVLLVPLAMSVQSLFGRRRLESVGRWLFGVVLLPYEAVLSADAIARVLVRLTLTHEHLLEWVTAAHAARALKKTSARRAMLREFAAALCLTLLLLFSVAYFRPEALLSTLPLFVLWLAAPELALWSGATRRVQTRLGPDDRRLLRQLARRTWLFFETFVGPGDQWLPPDNFQQEPLGRVAHRTSPTNIGLWLTAQLSARDLGYVGPSELSALLHHSFDSLGRLERYRGHCLNWYDTNTLEPLQPRYVSSVDSGNLLAALITLSQACREQPDLPILPLARLTSLGDALDLFAQALGKLPPALRPKPAVLAEFRRVLERAEHDAATLPESLRTLLEDEVPGLERVLLGALEGSGDPADVATFREARTWLDRIAHQLRSLRLDLAGFLPWLELLEPAQAAGVELEVEPREVARWSLRQVRAAAARTRALLEARKAELATGSAARAWLGAASTRLAETETRSAALCDEFMALAVRAEAERRATDFTFLFDSKRKLFHIGYNVGTDQLDANYYDLLASEARVASFIAVTQKQVPPEHWYALGRPVTRIQGSVALLSWGGTMFEYLLPALFMRSAQGTLLARSMQLAVRAQIAYGKRTHTPWGISESGFAELDAQQNYQYRSFGVPGLGIRRGLGDDLVIAPYACVLGLEFEPSAVVRNLALLERIGALGSYGLFEAIDYRTTEAGDAGEAGRSSPGAFSIVRSHMAHHQGMVLAALNNALNADVLVERFHADPLIQTGELLLSERLPSPRVAETLEQPRGAAEALPTPAASFPSWIPERNPAAPNLVLLTNGRLTTLVTDSGAGFTRYRELAITRATLDSTSDTDGTWIYVRDERSGHFWSATPAPTRARGASHYVAFHPHKAEFHHREDGISIRTEIAVAPADDVEIRHLTLHNETDKKRIITLMSYTEPVLEAALGAARHRAFSRLFVECEAIPEQHGILAWRRQRASEEPNAVVVQRAVWESARVRWLGSELDRARFIGRRRDARAPRMLVERVAPSRASKAGLDVAMVLGLSVELEPSATVNVAFVTAVAKTRRAALDVSRRFGSIHAASWAIRDAERASTRRLERSGIAPEFSNDALQLVSRLLLPEPGLRAALETLRESSPAQRDLWGNGISGDDPLLVVKVEDPAETRLIEQVLAVYRQLRACRMPLELVFLDRTPSGYLSDDAAGVRGVLFKSGAHLWLQQKGGVFALSIDQLLPEQRRRIEAAARVLLDSARGSLHDQLQKLAPPAPPLPPFSGVLAPQADAAERLAPRQLLFANGLGGFSEDGTEYVIELQPGDATPAPWCNVLANADFGCLVSESSLGSTWSQNASERRLTPWRNDPVSDTPSEAVYLRDEQTAEVWSPTPLPAALGLATRVRHGAGYTVYERNSHGLAQTLSVFVPADAPVKIVRLTLENQLPRARRLTATYYVEWVLGTLREEHRFHVLTEFDPAARCLLARSAWNADFSECVAFVTSDRAPHGFTCDRGEFIGRSGSLREPEALGRWGLRGAGEGEADPCAALQTHLELAPGQKLELHFVLGEGRNRQQALDLAARFQEPAEVDAAWQSLRAHWDGILSAIQVKTPEPALDLLLNRWLLYQSLSSRFLARSAFYQSSGAFGFRDQLQDVMALLFALPELARAHILEAAAHQFEDGDVLHWWHPPAGRGVRTRCSDDLLWLPFVVAHYVQATGDSAILDESVRFLAAPPLRPEETDRFGEFAAAARPASLLEHCRRALERGFTEGPHALPLMGGGDWNDGMNRVGAQGRGESVWLGWFTVATADAFGALLERVGQRAEAARWQERADALRARVEQTAWDGAWFLRGFYDDGTPLGSARSRTCQIDSIAQSWAILAGARNRQRALQALHAADARLIRDSERLVLLLTPPFEGIDQDPGYIAAYPRGVRENGGQYTHAAAWLGFAHARAGDGSGAARIFRLLNPILRTQTPADVERYRVEPYALAADVYGVAPFVGRGGWTWYTGAAAWTWRLGVEAMLGLVPEAGGVRFEPCIPPEWPGFEATIRLGRGQLHVMVENPERTGRGIQKLTLDGVDLASPLLELAPDDGDRHELQIVLGPALARSDAPAKPDDGVANARL